MKGWLLLLMTSIHFNFIIAQNKTPFIHLKKDIQYTITGDNGYNALSVAYNSKEDIYYCTFAGNSSFPLESFSNNGRELDVTTCGQDMRGFWYNPFNNKLEGSIFNGGGFFQIELLNNGTPGFPNIRNFDFPLPDVQSVTVFNPKQKEILSFFKGKVYSYNYKTLKKKKEISLNNVPCSWNDINPYSLFFTGYNNYEYGIFDFQRGKIYLFNKKGDFTFTQYLPSSAPLPDVFCFSFANDRVWIYDTETRTWNSYLAFY